MGEAAPALSAALAALAIEPDPGTTDRLLQYVALLARHGATHNLVGTLDPARIAVEIVADSLLAVEALRSATSAVDVGSGAGVPGIPLAILLPHVQFTLIEPRRKRVDFLRAARLTLSLANVVAVEGRVETAQAAISASSVAPFEAAVSRAVFAPDEWVAAARRLVRAASPICVWLSGGNAPGFVAGQRPQTYRSYTLPGLEERGFAVVCA